MSCNCRTHPLEGELQEGKVEALAREAQIFAAAHGMVRGKAGGIVFSPIPCTLLPSPVPKQAFESVRKLAVPFNELVHSIAADTAFLKQSLALTVKSDAFTRKLVEILDESLKFGSRQKGVLGIHRSDYMFDAPNDQCPNERALQVELNTISSAFSIISTTICSLHNHLLFRCCPDRVPVSSSNEDVPRAIAEAWGVFGHSSAVVMMVVKEGEDNVMDQRQMEFALLTKHHIRVIRKTFAQIEEQATINEDGDLVIDGLVVAVAYFRAGYNPQDYASEKHWEARLRLECSSAIKCPNVAYQLVGAKKIQQMLAVSGVLERFVKDEATASALRECFAGLYSLDQGSEGRDQVIERALANPELFVMKPQREGGGNNLYEEHMVQALKTLSEDELSSYILMDRIRPIHFESLLLRDGEVIRGQCVSELGIFSTFLARASGEVVLNEEAGFLLRTKLSSALDGGVSANIAVMDSPLLSLS